MWRLLWNNICWYILIYVRDKHKYKQRNATSLLSFSYHLFQLNTVVYTMAYLGVHTMRDIAPSETDLVPESYRPLILACVGLWGWVIVLCVMHWQRIDVNLILHTTSPPPCTIRPSFLLAASLTLIISFHIFLMEHTLFTVHTNKFNQIGPVIFCYAIAAMLALFGPCKKQVDKFLKCLYRLFFQFHGRVYFSDVLIADILISFSGVFTGMFIKLMDYAGVSYARYVPYVNR